MRSTILQMLFCLSLCIAVFDAHAQEIRMGFCRTNITPGEAVLMSGYDSRDKPSAGVHDSLYAAALCFSDGTSKALMITSDVIGYSHDLADRLSARIAETTGVPAQNILITATHNHGGPSIGTYDKLTYESNRHYTDLLEEKLVDISRNAAENLQQVKTGRGKGSCHLNINRRARFADGAIGLGRNQEGPCDHDVEVIKIESLQGDLLAVFVNWACHGTASGSKNYQVTGDWPGLAARYLEEELGEEIVVFVTAGASGDVNALYGPNDNFKEITTVGYNLAREVLEVLPGIETKTSAHLNVTQKRLLFPGKKPLPDYLPPERLEEGEEVEVRLAALKFGDITFTGISGEVMTEIGTQVKERSPAEGTVVITHCNGSSGYICTDKTFPEGGYEIKVTRLMPGAEKTIVENLLGMVRDLE